MTPGVTPLAQGKFFRCYSVISFHVRKFRNLWDNACENTYPFCLELAGFNSVTWATVNLVIWPKLDGLPHLERSHEGDPPQLSKVDKILAIILADFIHRIHKAWSEFSAAWNRGIVGRVECFSFVLFGQPVAYCTWNRGASGREIPQTRSFKTVLYGTDPSLLKGMHTTGETVEGLLESENGILKTKFSWVSLQNTHETTTKYHSLASAS